MTKSVEVRTGGFSGIVLMLLAMCFLSTMDAIAKWLMELSATPIQLLALRSLIIVPIVILYFWMKGESAQLLPTRPIAQGIRGTLGFIAPFSFFVGLNYLPLTAAVVVFFSSIFFTTLLSIVILKENVGVHRWMAVVVGYCGVALAMMPWSGGEFKGYLLVLISSITYSALFISGKYLAKTESVTSLVLSYNLGVGVVSLILLPWFWSNIEWQLYLGVLLLSMFAVAGHFAMTKAFSISEASQITPFEYTGILWTLLFDIVIWQVFPSQYTLAGAVIIITSSLYVIHRERAHGLKMRYRESS